MAVVSRGAHEMGGRVVGLLMQRRTAIEPNPFGLQDKKLLGPGPHR